MAKPKMKAFTVRLRSEWWNYLRSLVEQQFGPEHPRLSDNELAEYSMNRTIRDIEQSLSITRRFK
jgi:hypothetical protein